VSSPAEHRALQEAERKSWATLAARAALAGWQLWRTDPGDGAQRFFAGRWGLVRTLADLDEVERFLEHVGAAR
jgi:hypothetical protein